MPGAYMKPSTGDYQFDIYRLMKHLTRGEWDGFHPITNILVSCFTNKPCVHNQSPSAVVTLYFAQAYSVEGVETPYFPSQD